MPLAALACHPLRCLLERAGRRQAWAVSVDGGQLVEIHRRTPVYWQHCHASVSGGHIPAGLCMDDGRGRSPKSTIDRRMTQPD